MSDLVGKTVGLYFAASWFHTAQCFTPRLVELYQELGGPNGSNHFEVVYISSDTDEESFSGYFSKMPWLAVPFSESSTRKRLKELFKVMGIPEFVILDANGNVSTLKGTKVVWEYGAEGFPFTPERINCLIEEERAAKLNPSLNSILVSRTSNCLISNYGNLVLYTYSF